MAYKGVDLTHDRWLLAPARFESAPSHRLVPATAEAGDGWPTETILDGSRAFWKEVKLNLAPESLEADIPQVFEESIKPVLESCKAPFGRKVFGNENPSELWVAFAYPYGMPPLLRRGLRYLVPHETIRKQPIARRSTIEAPIALALEAVARREVQSDGSASVLLLTGRRDALELTAAALSRDGETLTVAITSYSAIDPDDIPGSLRGFTARCRRGHLLHAGIPDVAEVVSAAPGMTTAISSVIDLGEQATAIGALRHGGLLDKQYWLETRINDLKVERIAPVALGVIGTNAQGDWFWRRLLEKGAPIPATSGRADLIAADGPPKRIALVECPRANFAARRWLASDDWVAAGLRWHDIITVDPNDPKLATWELRYWMGVNNQHWNRLASLHWKVVPGNHATDSADPESP